MIHTTERTPAKEWAIDAQTFRDWFRGDLPDTDMQRLRQALPYAIRWELTEKQRLYLLEYYVDGRSLAQISYRYCVSRSTVSRGITRARKNLWKALRYNCPRLLDYNGRGIHRYNK